jgi:hypothetical protein
MNFRAALMLASLFTLAACERENAPSDSVKQAAETIVEQVEGSTQPAPRGEGAYAPRDGCAQKPGATEFRRALVAAVKARDAEALAALAAPDVKLDFGGGAGRAELRKRLSDKDAPLWEELDELLALGCAVNEQGGITMPWHFAQEIGGVDPMMGMIVTGEKVPLLDAPAEDAKPVAQLSWDAVELAGGLQPEAPFQKVTTTDGKSGFVASDKLRSLIDYRIIASSRDGEWSFTTLVAGD